MGAELHGYNGGKSRSRGGSRGGGGGGGGGGGAPGARPPKIGKNMIFWRKIVIFHTKYPKNFRASLCSAQFF
jgi:hypothetical protein